MFQRKTASEIWAALHFHTFLLAKDICTCHTRCLCSELLNVSHFCFVSLQKLAGIICNVVWIQFVSIHFFRPHLFEMCFSHPSCTKLFGALYYPLTPHTWGVHVIGRGSRKTWLQRVLYRSRSKIELLLVLPKWAPRWLVFYIVTASIKYGVLRCHILNASFSHTFPGPASRFHPVFGLSGCSCTKLFT